MRRLVLLRLWLCLAAILLPLSMVVAGCGATAEARTGEVPKSASLAPADAIAFVTLVTDEGSTQWKKAERLLDLFPSARDDLFTSLRDALAKENLTWEDDIIPAIGPEVVVVVTAAKRPVALTRPDSDDKLAALLAAGNEPTVHQKLAGGWTAIAEKQSDLDSYRAAVARGTLESVESFTDAMETLPPEALARAWVDIAVLQKDLQPLLQSAGSQFDLGIDSVSGAVTVEDDGVLLSIAARTPDGTGTTRYEPKLFGRVPSDAVVALSFGGSQGALDRLQERIDLRELSKQLEDAVGVTLDAVLDALSGEGVLYVAPGTGQIPEVTLVLAPPDPTKTWETVDRLVRRLGGQLNRGVTTRNEDGVDVSALEVEDVRLSYARLDEDAIIVTVATQGIARFRGDGPRLADTGAFKRAAERAGLGDSTHGFLYVDIDGLIPFVEDLAGPGTISGGARDAVEKLDSFILLVDGDDRTTRISGFLRVNS